MATICPKCHKNKIIECPECNGEGWVWRNKDLHFGFDNEKKTCPRCRGAKEIICPICDGRGVI